MLKPIITIKKATNPIIKNNWYKSKYFNSILDINNNNDTNAVFIKLYKEIYIVLYSVSLGI